MPEIKDRNDLSKIIAELKQADQVQEERLFNRLKSPKAVLASAWTLFPWSAARRRQRRQLAVDDRSVETHSAPKSDQPDEADRPKRPTGPFKAYFTKSALKNGFTILKAAFSGFMDDLALKYSASLAYYTIFSLAPLLLLVISIAGLVFGRDASQGKIFYEINGLVGNDAAKQIQDMIKHLELSGKSTISVVIGVVTLIIGASTVFGEIQESINIIWQVKPKPKVGWIKLVKNRLLSGSMIVTIGFLLMVSLIVNGALLALSDHLKHFLPAITVTLFNILNAVISFIVIAVLFGVIFKVLPDAKIGWRDVRSGAIFTAVLFMIGRIVIGIYIEKSGTSSTYGAAGSLIVILLWIYYTAAILYFGAEFTRAYADFYGIKIEPAEFAVHVEQKEETRDVAVVPPKHEIGKSS